MIVDCGAVPALVRHLQAPLVAEMEGGGARVALEHEVEKGSAFTLGLLAVKVNFGDCVCVLFFFLIERRLEMKFWGFSIS